MWNSLHWKVTVFTDCNLAGWHFRGIFVQEDAVHSDKKIKLNEPGNSSFMGLHWKYLVKSVKHSWGLFHVCMKTLPDQSRKGQKPSQSGLSMVVQFFLLECSINDRYWLIAWTSGPHCNMQLQTSCFKPKDRFTYPALHLHMSYTFFGRIFASQRVTKIERNVFPAVHAISHYTVQF